MRIQGAIRRFVEKRQEQWSVFQIVEDCIKYAKDGEGNSEIQELEMVLTYKRAERDWHEKKLHTVIVSDMDADEPDEYCRILWEIDKD